MHTDIHAHTQANTHTEQADRHTPLKRGIQGLTEAFEELADRMLGIGMGPNL